jgi:hypothetical protein
MARVVSVDGFGELGKRSVNFFARVSGSFVRHVMPETVSRMVAWVKDGYWVLAA